MPLFNGFVISSLLLLPILVVASAMRTCKYEHYPFVSNPSWESLLDACKLHQTYEGNRYVLRVELPDTLEDYVGVECLDLADTFGYYETRHFRIKALLDEDEPGGSEKSVHCQYFTHK